VLLAALSGCSVCQHARRTVLFEPLDYGWKLDRARSLKTYRRWAVAAWRVETAACPEAAASPHYGQGFQDGFVDYIYAGGEGEPPPIPPRKFWNMAWRGPTGQAAANQWFAGFRRGAQAAHDGGYRQHATVESSYRTAAHGEWDGLPLGPPAATEDPGPPGEPLPTPEPTLPELPAPGAALPTDQPPAKPIPEAPRADEPAAPTRPADDAGGARLFRRAIDAAAGAAPAADDAAAVQPLPLPPADVGGSRAPADREAP
jgi:hypothetical protein